MVLESKKATPAWLNGARPSMQLDFSETIDGLVNNHSDKVAAPVTVVSSLYGFKALLFRTTLNEDLDGHPMTYAPPTSAANLSSLNGLHALDHIGNATNQHNPVFHEPDPNHPEIINTWLWVGVKSAATAPAGRRIDDRPFLRDNAGRFPMFNRGAGPEASFYAPQTAAAMSNGDAVNPLEVPYAALSSKLRDEGNVTLGDFGLAIRASTGAVSPFVYADAGGEGSYSVGECSRKLIRNLFNGPATSETICYIVFPQSHVPPKGLIQPERMDPKVRKTLFDLQNYDNTSELPQHFTSRDAESDMITTVLTRYGAFRLQPPNQGN